MHIDCNTNIIPIRIQTNSICLNLLKHFEAGKCNSNLFLLLVSSIIAIYIKCMPLYSIVVNCSIDFIIFYLAFLLQGTNQTLIRIHVDHCLLLILPRGLKPLTILKAINCNTKSKYSNEVENIQMNLISKQFRKMEVKQNNWFFPLWVTYLNIEDGIDIKVRSQKDHFFML